MEANDSAQDLAGLLQWTGEDSTELIDRIVTAAKEHMEADVAFLSEFDGELKKIRKAVSDGENPVMEDGSSFALEGTYCYRVVRGTLPNIIRDARNDSLVRDLPITGDLAIGSYVGVPVVLPGGRVFGTLCCVNRDEDSSLTDRDARFMKVLANIIAAELHQEQTAGAERREKIQRIRSLLQGTGLQIVFQPIVDLFTGNIVGAEALSRFDAEPRRSPDQWFQEANEVGLGIELEVFAVQTAIGHIREFPDGAYLSINVAPATLVSTAFERCVADAPPGRLVVELTEHTELDKHDGLIDAIARLKKRGLRIAMDDVGAGYSGLKQLLRVAPDIVKLDRALTTGIDRDPVRQALVSASISFASRIHFNIVAEGVETKEEADALRILGVPYAQGYYFARPGKLPLQVKMT